tara:strand:+ start:5584 stop:5811 length:228 start_codon:yes stop_codon:yes gene_type:complete
MELKKGLEKIDGILNDFLMDEMMNEEDLHKVGEARGIIHTLVENLAIHNVSQQRELLKAFLEHYESVIDDYFDSL